MVCSLYIVHVRVPVLCILTVQYSTVYTGQVGMYLMAVSQLPTNCHHCVICCWLCSTVCVMWAVLVSKCQREKGGERERERER